MSHECQPPDWNGEYATTLKKMAIGLADGDRKQQIMVALEADEEDMSTLLRRVVKDHNGRKNTARRAINKQLEAADHYDHDKYGFISENTFYNWCDDHGVDDAES